MDADVTVTKLEKHKKGTMDLKIKLDHADVLMRKIWSQLGKACKEEGVKRFQIEASTPASPVKEKPKTELQKARLRVLELLEKEEDKLQKEADEKKQENQPSEGGDIIESALRSESHKESVEEVTTQPVLTLKETVPAARVASVQVEVGESSVLTKKSGDMEPSSQPSVAKQEVVRVKEQK